MLNYLKMSSSKNILILYITERSGHHSAAKALKKGFEAADPAVKVTCVNAFHYIFPFTERLTHIIYLFVIKRVPFIWKLLYDRPTFVKSTHGIKNWIHRRATQKIRTLLADVNPDAVVCTQAFPCGLFSSYKSESRAHLPLFGVLTDFAPHAYWIYDEVDGYIVGSEQTRQWLAGKGVKKDKIHALGIPIDPKFSTVLDRQEIIANYGLDGGVPTVLIMGGGHGLGPIKDILKKLDESALPLQFIVVCGINLSLYRWLMRQRFKKRMLAFRFTDEIHRLMSVSSVIISKPGGITTAEALAKQLPMISLKPIPGQETRNTDFLVGQKAAISASSVCDIVPAVEHVLTDISKPTGMKRAIVEAGLNKPKSAEDIARFILKHV